MSNGRSPERRFEYISFTVCPSTRSGEYDDLACIGLVTDSMWEVALLL
jgi:hypothetical protein